MVVTKGLIVDIGNTRIKAAVAGEGKFLSEVKVFNEKDLEPLERLVQEYGPSHSIIGSVSGHTETVAAVLSRNTSTLILSSDSIFPFVNDYATPHTLGMDRAAAVAGAMSVFPHQACLVIDAGTCVTFDFVTAQGHYLGGAISPGVNMRLQAMHTFTQKLPAISFQLPETFVGDSTHSSMLSGAYFGLLGEINDTISRYEEQFGPVQVLLCGGDAMLFDKRTKKNIFAAPDLVLHGLFKILQLNAT